MAFRNPGLQMSGVDANGDPGPFPAQNFGSFLHVETTEPIGGDMEFVSAEDFSAEAARFLSLIAASNITIDSTSGSVTVEGLSATVQALQVAATLLLKSQNGDVQIIANTGNHVVVDDDGTINVRANDGKALELRAKQSGVGAGKVGEINLGLFPPGSEVLDGPSIILYPKGTSHGLPARPYIVMGTNIDICGLQQVNPGDLIAGAAQNQPATPAGYIAFTDASGVGGIHVPYFTR